MKTDAEDPQHDVSKAERSLDFSQDYFNLLHAEVGMTPFDDNNEVKHLQLRASKADATEQNQINGKIMSGSPKSLRCL